MDFSVVDFLLQENLDDLQAQIGSERLDGGNRGQCTNPQFSSHANATGSAGGVMPTQYAPMGHSAVGSTTNVFDMSQNVDIRGGHLPSMQPQQHQASVNMNQSFAMNSGMNSYQNLSHHDNPQPVPPRGYHEQMSQAPHHQVQMQQHHLQQKPQQHHQLPQLQQLLQQQNNQQQPQLPQQQQLNRQQPQQRPSSNDARLEDFLSSLSNMSGIDSPIQGSEMHLLSEVDPQSQELTDLVRELSQTSAGSFNPKSPSSAFGGKDIHNLVSEKLKQYVAHEEKRCSENSEKQSGPSSKLNPTLTNILLHGSEENEMYGPITPLKNKPQSPTCDLEGSLLLLQNVHNIPTPLLLPAFSSVINSEMTNKASNITIQNDQQESSHSKESQKRSPTPPPPPQESPTDPPQALVTSVQAKHEKSSLESSDDLHKDIVNDSVKLATGNIKGNFSSGNVLQSTSSQDQQTAVIVVSSPESCSNASEHDRLSFSTADMQGKSRNAINARNNREKKKIYIKNIEEKLERSLEQNQKLTVMTCDLQRENERLKKENSYLKKMVTNQESINEILKKLPDSPLLNAQLTKKRQDQNSNSNSSNSESESKKAKFYFGPNTQLSPDQDNGISSVEVKGPTSSNGYDSHT